MNRGIIRYTMRAVASDKLHFIAIVACLTLNVALLVTMSLTFTSVLQANRDHVASSEGAWQVRLDNLSQAGYQALTHDADVTGTTLVHVYGSSYTTKSHSNGYFGPYLTVESIESNRANNPTVSPRTVKGRAPRNAREIILPISLKNRELDALADGPISLGTTLTLDLGKRVSTYPDNYGTTLAGDAYTMVSHGTQLAERLEVVQTRSVRVVGFYTGGNWESGGGDIAFIGYDKTVEPLSTTAFVRLKPNTNSEQLQAWYRSYATIRMSDSDIPIATGHGKPEYAADATGVSYRLHKKLLAAEGTTQPSRSIKILQTSIVAISLIVSAISCVTVLGCFNMGIDRRIRQLGLLATAGATKRQLRQSIAFEALIALIPSLLLGLAMGIAISQALFRILGTGIAGLVDATATVPHIMLSPKTLLPCLFVTGAFTCAAAAISAYRATRIGPLSALTDHDIRNEQALRPRKHQMRHRCTSGSIPIELALAHRKIKENHSRTISIVGSLSLAFTFVTALAATLVIMNASLQKASGRVESDIEVNAYSFLKKGETLDSQRRRIESLKTDIGRVDGAQIIGTYSSVMPNAIFPAGTFSTDPEVRTSAPGIRKDGSYTGNLNVVFLDQETWKSYLNELGIDSDKVSASRNMTAIALNSMEDPDHPDADYLEPYSQITTAKIITRIKQIQGYIFTGITERSTAHYTAIDPEVTKHRVQNESVAKSTMTAVDIDIVGITDTAPQELSITYDVPTIIMSQESLASLVEQTEASVQQEPLDESNPYATSTVPFYFNVDGIYGLVTTIAVDADRAGTAQHKIQNIIWKNCTGPTWGNVSISNYSEEIGSAYEEAQAIKTYATIIVAASTLMLFVHIAYSIVALSLARKRETAMLFSLGMEARQLRKMVRYEAAGYLVRAICTAAGVVGIASCLCREYVMPYVAQLGTGGLATILSGPLAMIALFYVFYNACCRRNTPQSIIETLRDDL